MVWAAGNGAASAGEAIALGGLPADISVRDPVRPFTNVTQPELLYTLFSFFGGLGLLAIGGAGSRHLADVFEELRGPRAGCVPGLGSSFEGRGGRWRNTTSVCCGLESRSRATGEKMSGT